MGNHHNRGAEIPSDLLKDRQHLDAGLVIQSGSWLVGEDDLRALDNGTGYRHTLLLPAGQRGRIVPGPIREAHLGDRLGGRHGVRRNVRDKLHVFLRREIGHEIIGLKDEAEVVSSEQGKFLIGGMGKIFSVNEKLALGEKIHAGDDVDHRGLAAAGLAQNHHKLIPIDVQVDPLQHAGHPVTGGIVLG